MIYLDNHATTPVDPRVREAMVRAMGPEFANPGSTSHAPGRAAAAAVARAREQIAALLNAQPSEIVFTSGATEANNLALLGAVRRHVITTQIEHPAVLETVEHLVAQGCTATILPVDSDGRVRPADVEAAIRPETDLVSVMAANNEVGTIQPIAKVARICRQNNVLLHSDASQAIKQPFPVADLGVDLLSLTGHKFHGPIGCGALFVRDGVELAPQSFGGGQEGGRRAGTLNLPGIVGLGEACEILRVEGAAESVRIAALRDRLHQRLATELPCVELNGPSDDRLPGNLHVSFRGVNSAELMAACPQLAVSAGAACHSENVDVSPVLAAIGVDREGARGAIRFGLGRFTTEAEIEAAASMVIEAVLRLKT